MSSKPDKKNVLYLSPTQQFYGAERCLFELVKYLDKEAFTPLVIAQEGACYEDFFKGLGIEFFLMNLIIPTKFKYFVQIIRLNYKLIFFVIKHKVDLVHINFHLWHDESLIPFFLFLKMKGVPWVYHLRFYHTFNAVKRLFMFRGRIIAISESVRRAFFTERRFGFLALQRMDRISTIHDGKDLSDYLGEGDTTEIRKTFKLDGKKVVGLVGAIDPRKRQDLFLSIARTIKNEYPGVKFLIIGDIYGSHPGEVEYKKRILKMVEDLGLNEDVIFTGYRNDVYLFLKLMDICVLTSKEEGLGMVIIEAMASGKPVVATGVGGIQELVEDGKTGFLVYSDEPRDYAKRITGLLDDEHKRAEMGMLARKRAVELFSIENHVTAIQDLYGRLLP
jgi:glycosyltransferase involved in cell wall biosynthesis